VSFTDTSTGSPTSWSWSFGDGTTSTSQHPSHAYTGAGTYTVSLTATNATGTDTETKVDHITVVSTQHRFNPVADARVNARKPSANYGTESTLKAKGGSFTNTSYLKFTVRGVSGPAASVKLRLRVTDGSVHGGSIRPVVDTTWTESGITFRNAPAISSTVLSSTGAVTNGQTVEFDLGSAITGDGTYSLALTSTSSDSVAYSSRQGTSPPELVITTGP
jgi:PKD repeat protein